MTKEELKKVIIIAGPTAVGKTSLSIDLARQLDGEIISADSMQIYKGMDIGSATPAIDEIGEIPHHMLSMVSPFDAYSVSDYVEGALGCIDDILQRGKTPIVVGGTGLYINALMYEMDFGETQRDDNFRKELVAYCEANGPEALHERLKNVDPEAAQRIHYNNTRKVIRALEVNHITGETMKDFAKDPVPRKGYKFELFVLNANRKRLYVNINRRVDIMLKEGLLEEVEKLKKLGLNASYTSMKGIGYKEVLLYLDDKCDFEMMVSILKQNSRRYAKRQLTWFRRYPKAHWLMRENFASNEELLSQILVHIE